MAQNSILNTINPLYSIAIFAIFIGLFVACIYKSKAFELKNIILYFGNISLILSIISLTLHFTFVIVFFSTGGHGINDSHFSLEIFIYAVPIITVVALTVGVIGFTLSKRDINSYNYDANGIFLSLVSLAAIVSNILIFIVLNEFVGQLVQLQMT